MEVGPASLLRTGDSSKRGGGPGNIIPLRVQRPERGEVCECVCGWGLLDGLQMTTFSS